MEELFNNCMVDIGEEGFVEKFKSLHRDLNLSFGVEGVSDKSIIKYLVASYDMNSPFVVRYVSWAQRRRETAKFAELPTYGDELSFEAEKIIRGRNLIVNKVALRYMFLQNNLEFIQLMTKQKSFEDQVEMTHSGKFDKPADYDKLDKNIDQLAKDIKVLQKIVFHGDEWKEWRKALYNFAGNLRTDFAPEDIAQRLQNNEPIVDDVPYPEYEPGEMRFLDDK